MYIYRTFQPYLILEHRSSNFETVGFLQGCSRRGTNEEVFVTCVGLLYIIQTDCYWKYIMKDCKEYQSTVSLAVIVRHCRPICVQNELSIVVAYTLILDWCTSYLSDPSQCQAQRSIAWSNIDAVAAVIRGVLSPKRGTNLSPEHVEIAVALTIETFVSSIDTVLDHPEETLHVQFAHMPSQAFSASTVTTI
jgi:hypothetical protein